MVWQKEVWWHRLDERGNERGVLACGEEACVIDGVGVLAFDGSGMLFEYHLEYGLDWVFSGGLIIAKVGEETRTRLLELRAGAEWFADGDHFDQFDGFDALDLVFSPSAMSATIQRLALEVGDEGQVSSVVVGEPTLALTPATQKYTRTGKRAYERTDEGGTTLIEVDDEGVVTEISGRFERSKAEQLG